MSCILGAVLLSACTLNDPPYRRLPNGELEYVERRKNRFVPESVPTSNQLVEADSYPSRIVSVEDAQVASVVKYTNSSAELYRQSVRGRISAIATRMIEDMVSAVGDGKSFHGEKVRFSFTINIDGSLGGVEILEQHTTASPEIRELVMPIMDAAAPFSPVPREVLGDDTELTYDLEFRYLDDRP